MTTDTNSSRRAFFLKGGAMVGAGVGAGLATAVGASAAAGTKSTSHDEIRQLQVQLDHAQGREAIRQLHLALLGLLERQHYHDVAGLFDESAQLNLGEVRAAGKEAIARTLTDQYLHQRAKAIPGAYRQNTSQHKDVVSLSQDGQSAVATFHVEVELCTPLDADCTAAQMARFQGNVAGRRWESGRFDAQYAKKDGQWKVASLHYEGDIT